MPSSGGQNQQSAGCKKYLNIRLLKSFILCEASHQKMDYEVIIIRFDKTIYSDVSEYL